MATIESTSHPNLEKLSWYLGHCTHTVWDSFGADQQNQMVEDDLAAGKYVPLVLGSLITAGMVLCILTLLVVLATT